MLGLSPPGFDDLEQHFAEVQAELAVIAATGLSRFLVRSAAGDVCTKSACSVFTLRLELVTGLRVPKPMFTGHADKHCFRCATL